MAETARGPEYRQQRHQRHDRKAVPDRGITYGAMKERARSFNGVEKWIGVGNIVNNRRS